jgi:hypothetical protein
MALCLVADCGKPIRARGYCTAHYGRLLRHGDPTAGVKTGRKPKPKPECSAAGCQLLARRRGYCPDHLAEHLADERARDRSGPPGGCEFEGCPNPPNGSRSGHCHGHSAQLTRGVPLRPLRARRPRAAHCQAEECRRPVLARNYCITHYERWRQGQDVDAPILTYAPRDVPCSAEGCDRDVTSEGLCRTHYRRRLRGESNWDRPIPRKAPNGAGHTDKKGYRQRTVNGRRAQEHVLIMEELLGRRLIRGETVHHCNTVRDDNRTDGPLRLTRDGSLRSGNLELWSKAHPAGGRIGDRLAFARQLLALYGSEEERARYVEHLPPIERL